MRIVWHPATMLGLMIVCAGLAWMTAAVVAGEGAPKEGDKAPAVALTAALPEGKTGPINLKDYQGKKNVVLYFFPKALTGG
jgi:hypothetical protein